MNARNSLVRTSKKDIPSIVSPKQPQEAGNGNKKNLKNRKILHIFNIKLRYFSTLFFIFCCSLTFLLSFSYSTLINDSISKYKKELTDLQDENIALRVQIAEQVDLKYIEEIATMKLGMSKPKPYQELYIIIPKSDHTITFDEDNMNEEQQAFPIVDNLLNFLERIGSLWSN